LRLASWVLRLPASCGSLIAFGGGAVQAEIKTSVATAKNDRSL